MNGRKRKRAETSEAAAVGPTTPDCDEAAFPERTAECLRRLEGALDRFPRELVRLVHAFDSPSIRSLTWTRRIELTKRHFEDFVITGMVANRRRVFLTHLGKWIAVLDHGGEFICEREEPLSARRDCEDAEGRLNRMAIHRERLYVLNTHVLPGEVAEPEEHLSILDLSNVNYGSAGYAYLLPMEVRKGVCPGATSVAQRGGELYMCRPTYEDIVVYGGDLVRVKSATHRTSETSSATTQTEVSTTETVVTTNATTVVTTTMVGNAIPRRTMLYEKRYDHTTDDVVVGHDRLFLPCHERKCIDVLDSIDFSLVQSFPLDSCKLFSMLLLAGDNLVVADRRSVRVMGLDGAHRCEAKQRYEYKAGHVYCRTIAAIVGEDQLWVSTRSERKDYEHEYSYLPAIDVYRIAFDGDAERNVS